MGGYEYDLTYAIHRAALSDIRIWYIRFRFNYPEIGGLKESLMYIYCMEIFNLIFKNSNQCDLTYLMQKNCPEIYMGEAIPPTSFDSISGL